MTGKVKYIDSNSIFIQTANVMVPVFPVYHGGQQYYPIVARYASTIQGYGANIAACNSI